MINLSYPDFKGLIARNHLGKLIKAAIYVWIFQYPDISKLKMQHKTEKLIKAAHYHNFISDQLNISWQVCEEAIQALGELRDKSTIEPLCELLTHENWTVRVAAVNALMAFNGPNVVNALIESLQDIDWHVRYETTIALGKLGDDQAVEPLIEALKDEEWIVSMFAARALGSLKDPRATQPLIERLHDHDWFVRASAAKALAEISNSTRPDYQIIIQALAQPAPDDEKYDEWVIVSDWVDVRQESFFSWLQDRFSHTRHRRDSKEKKQEEVWSMENEMGS
jgi:HEAT repeat protein